MITYRHFVTELEPLVAEARTLRNAERLHEDPQFRKWRNKVTQLLAQVVQQDYLITCKIKHRGFGAYYTANPKAMASAYQQELEDTINELEFIIENFNSHGEPPKGSLSKEATQLKWPDKITLAWLFKHAPWTFWTGLVGLLVAAFVLGTQIGQTKLYQQFMDALQPSQTVGQK